MNNEDLEFAAALDRLAGIVQREARDSRANEIRLYFGEENAWVEFSSGSRILRREPIPSRTLHPLIERFVALVASRADGGRLSMTIRDVGEVDAIVRIEIESLNRRLGSSDESLNEA